MIFLLIVKKGLCLTGNMCILSKLLLNHKKAHTFLSQILIIHTNVSHLSANKHGSHIYSYENNC